jgi:putative endopeptidase
MVDAIVRALHAELGRVDWMGEATRGVAQQKLARLVRLVGFPDAWRASGAEVRRDDFAGNALRTAAFETRSQLARAGRPVDRGDWQLPAYQVEVAYDLAANTAVLPAGILQPPFFGLDRAVAANLGGLGTAIGHELIHGFDDQGAQLGGDGNLAAWWQQDDAARFAERRTCVADMYSTFEVMPKAFVDGKLTAGESIADAGGVRIAFDAYRALRKDATAAYVADGFTEDQQFFIAVGQAWCSRDRIAETQRRLISDPHAPPKFRVYGALRNLKEFAEAFSCAPGTPMHPARTCSVW